MQPNIPIQYSTLAEYIEALSGAQVSAVSQSVNAQISAINTTISSIQSSVVSIVDSATLNSFISANASVAANTAHRLTVSGNPHAVTKADVGLGNVTNHDFTAEVAANTAKVGITTAQANAIIANTAKVGITTQQATDITAANTHIAIIAGNPHGTSKAQVGLGNVPNIDCTNASNITTGTLPNSVLPPLAITDTFSVATQSAQLAITCQKGDIAVRTDLSRSFINTTGNNTSMSDWQELLTPIDTVLSVNGHVGVISLTTTDISEGTNMYYTNTRVSANTDVATNTANRHAHGNKTILDNTTASFTIQNNADITLANVHRATVTGNPHAVTKAEVGLGNVPNTDFTAAVAANTAKVGITIAQAADIISANVHRATTTGNPHAVTKADIGLGNLVNTDFTADVLLANQHRAIVTGNPHQVTKAEVGLGNVTNHDFTAEVNANTAKVGITTGQAAAIVANTAKVGITTEQAAAIVLSTVHDASTANPHGTTAAQVGLGNVKNIDTTNASNITTGTLPTSVLPPLAIVDTFVVATQAAQLALTVQKGDVAVRTDLSRSFINLTGNNASMADWQELMTPIDTILTVNGQTGTVVLSTTNISEGTNLYYTEARVAANTDVAANTANRHNHANKAILDATNASFTTTISAAIDANTAKVGITVGQAAAIVANTAKVGITTQQTADIVSANAHRAIVAGNPHSVTKAEVGLSIVPNTDFTTPVANNTAHRGIITGNPHQVTKAEVGLGLVTNHDFTTEVNANTTHRGVVSGNPHQVTKAEVGLSLVPNHDFTAEVTANTAKVGITTGQAAAIVASTAHDAIIAGNPHQVTKAEIGLGLVPNIDCTNASNITTGMLPSSVLPPIAIVDTYPVASEAAQLALTIQRGDLCVRTDLSRTYINRFGANTSMSDWQELLTPTDLVLSVNGQLGTIVLTTTDIAEGTHLYYTDARVAANTEVATNTANRHNHGNKTILDATTASFVTQQVTDITAANTHRAITTGNPHQVTKAEVGLSVVPNHDFTAEVNANTAKVGITVAQAADIVSANTHRATVIGNPHAVTKAEVGLGNVTNHDFTAEVNANTAHRGVVAGNPHQVTKTEVGLSEVPNHDFTAEVNANTAKVGITVDQAAAIVANTAKVGITTQQTADIVSANTHRAIVAGNPHQVTKTEVGLSNVPNVDCTNASNITTGTLPTSVLPPLAITDTFVAVSQAAQLALTVQAGDICVRSDQSRTYINATGNNTSMADWQELSTPVDQILTVNGHVGTVVLSTTDIAEGSNLYYTEERVAANASVAANTAARHTHANKSILDATSESFTTAIVAAITANTAKVGITTGQAAAIVANTAKVGITPEQATSIVNADAHIATVAGNPHQVTKAEVGLSNVPNNDFTNAIGLNTAHRAIVAGNPHAVTKAEVGLGNVPNTDFTSAANNSAAHIATISGNPHHVNKTDVGLGVVPNHDFTDEVNANTAKVGITIAQAAAIVASTTHDAIVSGNPHQVTKTEVGLSNVPNVDCTNASNITTGMLPSSVLPPLAITDTFVVATQAAQLALTCQTGDICVRTDLSRSYVNRTGNNAAMSDWQELMTPINNILTVNGQTGTVVLSTTNISEGTNLYYTEERVAANTNVAANTANRNNHANKAILDATSASYTTANATSVANADTHRLTTTGNPHAVTKAEVGLGNVPNTNFTTNVANADAHIATVTGNPHQVTKAEVGLGNVTNHDFTAEVAANTAKVGITPEQTAAIIANTAKVGITTGQAADIVSANTHRAIVAGNPHQVTKTEVGLGNVPNHDFTVEVNANTAKVGITTGQAADIVSANTHRATLSGNPHQVTKTEVGLSNVPNTDFTTPVANATAHIATVTGNPHAVTKAQVGLSNVPNVDCTNASNITTGTLPTSVLPPLAITDTFVAATQVAQLALTVQKGDICVRSDQSRTYINVTGTNASMADWQELSTPTDQILTVNGQVGTVVLTTTNVAEGTNLYYTESRVSANASVAANTANRHNHANKTILDNITASFTTQISSAIDINTAKVGITAQQTADILSANTHRAIVSGNPHNVNKSDVGLSNVPNLDFTTSVAAATAHIATVTGNPHHVTKADIGLGNVVNTDFTASASASAAHIATVTGNPHQVTKADVGLSVVPNHDFTSEVNANTAKVGITTQQAADIVSANTHRATVTGNVHQVTKAEVGLGSVPNTDFTSAVAAVTATSHTHSNKSTLDATTSAFTTGQADEIVACHSHRLDTSTNPHAITPAMIGAEVPAGAQAKASLAQTNANAYTDTYMTKQPNAPLFDAPLRNSLALDKGVGTATFTRGSIGHHQDRYGIVRESAVNQPRFDKSGLLIEGQSTNYFAGSKDASVFTKTNCHIDLDKQYDASFLIDVDVCYNDVPNIPWSLSKTLTNCNLAQGQYYTFSLQMKSTTGVSLNMKIRDSSGMNAGDFGGVKAITLTPGLNRYDFTVYVPNATTGHPVVTLEPTTVTAGSSFSLVCMQFENLNFASSIIDTTVATDAVTRQADSMSMPYVENFPGSLNDKTVMVDVEVIGIVPGTAPMCFASGDLQLYVGDGTATTPMCKVAMGPNAETGYIANSGKFRFGATYDATLQKLSMYHDGVLVASKSNVLTANEPLANVGSYDTFLAQQYPTLDPALYGLAVLQIPLDILQTELSFSSGNPFIKISNIKIMDQCLSAAQMRVA